MHGVAKLQQSTADAYSINPRTSKHMLKIWMYSGLFAVPLLPLHPFAGQPSCSNPAVVSSYSRME
jgi:hypothetical protein